MAIHIVGVNGLIGSTMRKLAEKYELTWGRDIHGYSSPEVSLLRENEYSFAALKLSPGDTIINCVGYTAVDMAESDIQRCYQLNAYGPAELAKYAQYNSCRFISLSTDYVFSPPLTEKELSQIQPWKPHDSTHVRCVYGASKLLGEQLIFEQNPAALIVRTAWVYATPEQNNSTVTKDFVSLVAHKALERENMNIVGDQIGSPTWTDDIAQALILLAQTSLEGEILHYAGEGACSWYQLAQEIYRILHAPCDLIREISSQMLGRAAVRPQYSVLDLTHWNEYHIYPTRPWKEALTQALANFI